MATNSFRNIGREEKKVELHFVKKKIEKFECMVVRYGDHKNSVKCLWIEIRWFITKDGPVLGICY